MNRRQLLGGLAALPVASEVRAQEAVPKYRLRSGLVAYSYRTALAAKTLTYEGLIQRIADWGLDGLDCTVYWFPDAPNTPNDWLASLRRTAMKYGVSIYNAGVRVRLCQPTAELQAAEFENIRKWVDVADRIGSPHVRVFGGPLPKGATEEQAIAWAAEVLKRGAEYSASRGSTLGGEDGGGRGGWGEEGGKAGGKSEGRRGQPAEERVRRFGADAAVYDERPSEGQDRERGG